MDPNAGESQPLVNLAFAALDHAVASIADSGGPLIPFALIEQEGQRRLERALGEQLEEGVAWLQARVSGLDGAVSAVAFDGYITTGEGRFDAIHIEARNASGVEMRLAQRYEVKGLVKKRVHPLGNPILVRTES